MISSDTVYLTVCSWRYSTISIVICSPTRRGKTLKRLSGRTAACLVSPPGVLSCVCRRVNDPPADFDNESEWDGTGRNSALADKGKGVGEELEEYEDEEQLATVTVVEEFDPDTFLYGKPSGPESTDDQSPPRPDKIPSRSHPPQPAKATSKDTSKAKVKAKMSTKVNNVKYQTSAARKAERAKQHRRKTEKAERAGGKASRRGGSKGRR